MAAKQDIGSCCCGAALGEVEGNSLQGRAG